MTKKPPWASYGGERKVGRERERERRKRGNEEEKRERG
jgi:hypothetical protein